jgi:hypothetical protein
VFGKVFNFFQNGQKINVQNKKAQIFYEKVVTCDHKLILWSGDRKNNFKFVMILFFSENYFLPLI